jgi:hypothetical protein
VLFARHYVWASLGSYVGAQNTGSHPEKASKEAGVAWVRPAETRNLITPFVQWSPPLVSSRNADHHSRIPEGV